MKDYYTNLGKQAYQTGLFFDDNPCADGSKAARYWSAGWNDAYDQHENPTIN